MLRSYNLYHLFLSTFCSLVGSWSLDNLNLNPSWLWYPTFYLDLSISMKKLLISALPCTFSFWLLILYPVITVLYFHVFFSCNQGFSSHGLKSHTGETVETYHFNKLLKLDIINTRIFFFIYFFLPPPIQLTISTIY